MIQYWPWFSVSFSNFLISTLQVRTPWYCLLPILSTRIGTNYGRWGPHAFTLTWLSQHILSCVSCYSFPIRISTRIAENHNREWLHLPSLFTKSMTIEANSIWCDVNSWSAPSIMRSLWFAMYLANSVASSTCTISSLEPWIVNTLQKKKLNKNRQDASLVSSEISFGTQNLDRLIILGWW